MGWKEYFDIELRTTLLNVVAGAIVGYVSFILNDPIVSAFVAVVAVALLSLVLNNVLGVKKDTKWWISNGVIIFIFTWFIVWIIFYNVNLIATLPR